MKKFLFASLVLLFATTTFAQNDIYLQINQMLGEQAYALNTSSTAPGDYPFEIDRLEYYISGMSITHDGGQITDMPEVHVLIKSQLDTDFLLGNYDIDQIESITFSIGVGPDYNHLDPATWGNHPLGPQNPSMHWGWTSGYRFIAMEGYSGSGSYLYEIHALGDDNYHSQTHEVQAAVNGANRTVVLNADYTKLLTDLDISSGGTFHSTNLPEAVQILENARDEVFSPGDASLSVEEVAEATITVAPNPSLGQQSVLFYEGITAGTTSLSIIDMTGKELHNERMLSNAGQLTLPVLAKGVYTLRVISSDNKVSTLTWVNS